MNPQRKCIHCGEDAYAIDDEYDEPYCAEHFDQQQRSSEPIECVSYLVEVEDA